MKNWFLILIPTAFIALVLIIVSLAGMGVYNNLVTKREGAKTAWSHVENQYQRRFDLIPNLVASVKAFVRHENETLTEVTRLRSLWGDALKSGDTSGARRAASGLDTVMPRLLLITEQYPEIRSGQNFLALQAQFEGTENRISVERRRYNEAVREYNIAIQTFPGNILAPVYGFSPMRLFETENKANKPPEISF